MEIFWRTIAYYNSATWLLQIIVILIGIVLTALLISKPRPWVKMGMKIYMIGLYSWISIVYYFIYCEERSYNGVMAMFWGVMAIIWIWDTIRKERPAWDPHCFCTAQTDTEPQDVWEFQKKIWLRFCAA